MKVELSPDIRVYTGRVRGREDRARFKLDSLDVNPGVVEIAVPANVYTMTSSYFLELLGKSIRTLGREAFLIKYQITGPRHVLRKVDDWIDRALREKRGLIDGALDE